MKSQDKEKEYERNIWEIYRKEWATANREKRLQLNKRMRRWQELMKSGWTPSQAYYKVMEEESDETLQPIPAGKKVKIKTNLKSGKGLIILGIVTGVLIATSLIMTVLVNNRIAAAQENGNNEGKAQGYFDGYNEGKSVGYDTGNEKGYSEGDGEGYTSGLTTGYEEGEEIGYEAGRKEGYDSGYITGFEEVIGTNYFVRNPTYNEVLKMLEKSEATSAWEINNYFEAEGIRTGYVWVNVAEEEGLGYSLVAFKTVDKGIIIVNPSSHEDVQLEVFEHYCADTISRITIIW